jgi:SecD/SecF fusion protein
MPWITVAIWLCMCLFVAAGVASIVALATRRLRLAGEIGVVALLVLISLVAISAGFRPSPRINLDVQGAVAIVYRVDQQRMPDDEPPIGELVRALDRRLIGRGWARPHGDAQVEIIVPGWNESDVALVKRLVSNSGLLEFRIVASAKDHSYIIDLARDASQASNRIVLEGDRPAGKWVRVARESNASDDVPPLKADVRSDIIRDAQSHQLLVVPAEVFQDTSPLSFERWLQQQNIADIEVLMATDDGFDVTGRHFASARAGFDELVYPCINFDMTTEGAALFGGLTGSNLPDSSTGHYRRLGIIMDDQLLSAPRILSTITNGGRITGRFTQEEVDVIVAVLHAGQLPAALERIPYSEHPIDAAKIAGQPIPVVAAASCVALFLTGLVTIVGFRSSGLAAVTAELVHAAMFLAVVGLLNPILDATWLCTPPLLLILALLVNWPLCHKSQRNQTSRANSDITGARRTWPLLLSAAAIHLLTFVAAIAIHASAADATRTIALVVAVASGTALLASVFSFSVLLDVASHVAGRNNQPPIDAILVDHPPAHPPLA